MSALQIWLRNHNRRLTQDAIDEALMEYIEKIEREHAQLKAVIEQQKEVIDSLTRLDRVDSNFDVITEQAALIEKLTTELKKMIRLYRVDDQEWNPSEKTEVLFKKMMEG